MSITITAQFIPQFASERSWRELDRYLTKPDGDWRMLRTYLIREICKHQRTHGIPISIDDELALIEVTGESGSGLVKAQAEFPVVPKTKTANARSQTTEKIKRHAPIRSFRQTRLWISGCGPKDLAKSRHFLRVYVHQHRIPIAPESS